MKSSRESRACCTAAEFTVAGWAARAPGIASASAWRAWAQKPHLPKGSPDRDAGDMPALLRRRLDAAGRLAATVAYEASPTGPVPTVFASRHGAAHRNVSLLDALAEQAPLSPTDFSLSVHNSVASLYSIARADVSTYTALSAGKQTAEAAVIEACGMLAEGCPEVLVVVYDAPLPDVYADFYDEPCCVFAWAWRLVAPLPGQTLRLQRVPEAVADTADVTNDEDSILPAALAPLRFFLAQHETRACSDAWQWSRDA